MEKILINGGKELTGRVNISAAKNAVLPIIASTILCDKDIIIKNAPMLEDVRVIYCLLSKLGAMIDIDNKNNEIRINNRSIIPLTSDSDLVKKMRASFLILGPMISRFGKCRLSLPGGCNIGLRPIDLHLKGLKKLGAEVSMGHGFVEVKCEKLKGNRIYLDFPSVGATENIIMAAVKAEGTTIVENTAQEPEIFDLCKFLNCMGADISFEGTSKIVINGVEDLRGISYTPISDRIEAGTFIAAAAITKSIIEIEGANEEHLRPVIEKMTECGVDIKSIDNGKLLIVDGRNERKGVNIKTMPYPGFPTDMQAPMMSVLSLAQGSSMVTETIFENRFMHVDELVRMGADIKVDGRTAFIEGVKRLSGCEVKATDLRAGAAMILAGLAADGYTKITDIYNIDRGYVKIEEKLRGLGADIKRINE